MPTTTISININTPTGVPVAAVVDALCTYWGYQDTVPNPTPGGTPIPNPQNKGAFIKSKIANFVRESYKAAKANTDVEVARQASLTASDLVTAD